MNKIPSIAAIVALITTLSFSQEGGTSPPPEERLDEFMLGHRFSFGLNNFTSGYKDVDKGMDIKMGYGFGAGLAFNIPLIGALSFNPELNFLYRILWRYTDPGIGVEFLGQEAKVNMSEFAVSVPALLRLTLGKIYLAGGVQLDIPFDEEFTFKEDGRYASLQFKDRAKIDFGPAVGLGYKIDQRLSVDFRWVIGLTSPINNKADKDKKSGFDQFSIGIAYLFSLPKPPPEEVKCPEPPPPPPPPEPEPELPKPEEENKLEAFSSQSIDVYKDERGTVLSMSDILFESGKAELKDELKLNLTELSGIFKSFMSSSYIVVEGHTDNVGAAEFNQTLSEHRAAAVLQFLVERGVDASKLKSVGYGFSKPIADNSTAEGRAKNRRVELVVTKEPSADGQEK